jgi:hypothetical protein
MSSTNRWILCEVVSWKVTRLAMLTGLDWWHHDLMRRWLR